MNGADGRRTTSLLSEVRYTKDNRLLPLGDRADARLRNDPLTARRGRERPGWILPRTGSVIGTAQATTKSANRPFRQLEAG